MYEISGSKSPSPCICTSEIGTKSTLLISGSPERRKSISQVEPCWPYNDFHWMQQRVVRGLSRRACLNGLVVGPPPPNSTPVLPIIIGQAGPDSTTASCIGQSTLPLWVTQCKEMQTAVAGAAGHSAEIVDRRSETMHCRAYQSMTAGGSCRCEHTHDWAAPQHTNDHGSR